MTHSRGLTISTQSVHKCHATSTSFAVCLFLPQPLFLLFTKSYIIPSFDYCDIVWSGCTKTKANRLENLLNYACRIVLHRSKRSSASAARREPGLSTLASPLWPPGGNFTSQLLCSTVCLPSHLLIYLSFSLHPLSTTTPALFHLPNSIFLQTDPLMGRNPLVSWVQHYGDHFLRTLGIPKTLIVIILFVNNISIISNVSIINNV